MSDDPLSVCCRHLAKSQHIIEEKNAEIARLRLTDAEREALESEVELAEYQQRHEAATLRGLLDRLGGKNE